MQNLAARRWVTRFIIAALALLGARAGAQGAPRFASPALPPDHWAVTAARRAVVLGLTPREIGWAEGSLTQALAGWALREASERSTSLAPAIHAAAAADWQRFTREFPEIAARLAPQFESRRYGDPGYAQLGRACAREIAAGAESGAAIGAFHDLLQPQREANLRARLDEFTPAGMDVDIAFES